MSMPMIGIRLNESEIEKLNKIAKEKERSLSNLVRIIIKNYLKQQEI